MKSNYPAYLNWATVATEEVRKDKLEIIKKLAGQSNEAVEEMQKAYREYADANGFKIEK
ncbi:MAG: hypothetical protein HOP10_15820 [Chitinophagaceae bacterium]|nr:hypothetical protein [Chitinophagaceae bacterium]